MSFPTPHLEKLSATHSNDKLPEEDRPRVEQAIERYKKWIADLDAVKGTSAEVLEKMVRLLNEYRMYIDVELVFDSPKDFLYRQKGQLKLDNSVIEEFLPRLMSPMVLPELEPMRVVSGPTSSFSSVYFNSSLEAPQPGGGLAVRAKNQDFAIAKPLYLKASHEKDFSQSVQQQTYISYISVECKTNLDKTMFQEACATAHDTKTAVAGARYYLLCEWLDMSPLSTAPTDIDEIIILRKAKRMNSNVRAHYSLAEKRRQRRDEYVAYLSKHSLRTDMFERLVNHIRELIRNEQPEERSVLDHGFF
jgi:hypothetical protein